MSIDLTKFPPIGHHSENKPFLIVLILGPNDDKEKVRTQQLDLIQSFADKLSRFRRNFYAAPFERAFEGVKNGKASAKCEYSCRSTEKVWIIPGS